MVTWGPGALAYVLFVGSLYAVPTVIYAAVAEAIAVNCFPKLPTAAFLALAALGLVLATVFLQFGPGHPSNKPFHTAESASRFIRDIGIPTFAVICVYTIAIADTFVRSRKH
jgi:hypothetical protein